MSHWKGIIRDQARRTGTRDSKKLPNRPVLQLSFTELGEGWGLKGVEKPDHVCRLLLVWGNGSCQETW